MRKTTVHRVGKIAFFKGVNTKQFSLGFWIDNNSASIDLGIVWFSIAWN